MCHVPAAVLPIGHPDDALIGMCFGIKIRRVYLVLIPSPKSLEVRLRVKLCEL